MAIFKKLAILFVSILFIAVIVGVKSVSAESTEELAKKISELEQKLAATISQKNTLADQIAYSTNQINLTEYRIIATQGKLIRLTSEIGSVSAKIGFLEDALGQTTKVLINRVRTTYKQKQTDPFISFISSSNFQGFVQQWEYLKLVQKHDKALLEGMSLSKKNYRDQKDLLEAKKKQQEELGKQLTAYQATLEVQKRNKESLLVITKNDEVRYQQLLSQARQELEGLRNSLFSSKKHVAKGEPIGLMGSTGFSSGPHLHFGVYTLAEGNADNFNYYSDTMNPLDYLKSKNLRFEASSCDDVRSSQNKTVGSGGKDWPMGSPTISQCYGHTPWSWMYGAVNFHHGLDMWDNSDIVVRAVEEGEAYFFRGTSSFGNNVRIFHSDGKMTLYLHLQ